MTFRNPEAFLLLLPLLAIFIRINRKILRGEYAPKIMAPWLDLWVPKVVRTKRPSPRLISVLGYLLASTFFIITLARPQTAYQKIKRTTEGIDIMLVLDLSASMRVEDFRDSNRMDIAKSVIKDFIAGRISDRIGLVGFSGEPITLAPPTLDYNLLLQQLESVEIGDLKDGTAIGEGLALAVTRLHHSKAKTKVIILVTDGDNNMGQIDPLTAGEMAKGYGIKVYSVAIGTEGRVRMPFVQKDIFGRTYRTYQYYDSSINPELLRQISQSTNGKFYRVTGDAKVFKEVFDEIDKLEKTEVKTDEQVKYNENFMPFLLVGLFLAIATWMASSTFIRVYP